MAKPIKTLELHYQMSQFLIIGNIVIEQVKCYTILGVILSNNLQWNIHVYYIVKKACKK